MQRRSMTTLLAVTLLIVPTGAAPAQEARVATLSQQSSPASPLLSKGVSIRFENVSMAVALMRLNDASGVPISFSPTMLSHHSRTSCRCEDVTLAAASNAVVIGFHVRPSHQARELAKRWLPAHFARIGDALAARYGLTVVLTGTRAEQPLTATYGEGCSPVNVSPPA